MNVLEGIWCAGKQTGSHENCLVKHGGKITKCIKSNHMIFVLKIASEGLI